MMGTSPTLIVRCSICSPERTQNGCSAVANLQEPVQEAQHHVIVVNKAWNALRVATKLRTIVLADGSSYWLPPKCFVHDSHAGFSVERPFSHPPSLVRRRMTNSTLTRSPTSSIAAIP